MLAAGFAARGADDLRGVGVDAERVERFARLANGGKPWRHVYSPREAAHLAAQADPALAFCFAFCCKEALCKALGAPYPFPELECLGRPGDAGLEPILSPSLLERVGPMVACSDDRFVAGRGECLVEVFLPRADAGGTAGARGGGAPPGVCLESIAVAAVEAERARIEAEFFRPAELADLGRRRVQSLAGFLAAKRALAALWAATGACPPPGLRDFELGHLASGAPRVVDAPGWTAPPDAGRGGARTGAVLVSISHTRDWAYALAAFADREGGAAGRG